MTHNMVGYQFQFRRKSFKKARWKRARKRWLIRNSEGLFWWKDAKTIKLKEFILK